MNLSIEADNYPSIAEQWLGFGLQGAELNKFMLDSAAQIRQGWISVYENSSGDSLTVEDYRKATSLGFFSSIVINQAIAWYKSYAEERRIAASDILAHQILKYSITTSDKLIRQHPNQNINQLELIQEGFLLGWEVLEQDSQSEELSVKINMKISHAKSIKSIIREAEVQTNGKPQPHDLEQASFVAVNLDEVIDPVEITEREDLSYQVRHALQQLTSRERTIIEKRFPQGDSTPISQLQIGKEEIPPISGARIGQIYVQVIQKLGKKSNAGNYWNYGTGEELGTPEYGAEYNGLRIAVNSAINAYHLGDLERAKRNLKRVRACSSSFEWLRYMIEDLEKKLK